MHTRLMSGAFLICNGKVLLIHRNMQRKLAPGMWSCVGGHMEASEINSPLTACYREIEEETGIKQEDVADMRLRYISTRNTGEEIRTGYYFIGNLSKECPLPECDEGTLHWVSMEDLAELPMTFSIKQITTHWLQNLYSEDVIL